MDLGLFNRMAAGINRRIAMMLARGVIALVDDAGGVQTVQARFLAGETQDGVERFQNYGLTSVPLAGMEVVAVFLGGERDHGIVVAVGDRDHRLRPLNAGEVALYDHLGKFVHLKDDGTLHIKADNVLIEATGTVTVDAATKTVLTTPTVEASATIKAVGDITALDGLPGEIGLGGFRDIYNTHVHPENDAGGPTDVPNQQA